MVIATARFWFKAEKYIDIILPDYAILADGTQIYHNGEMIHGYEMNGLASGKYQAVAKLGDMLQIGMDEMLGFGDDENDFDILKNVGKGVAVANAIPMVKEIADDIAQSNDEDGVAQYIEKELIPFWEKAYQKKETIAFSIEPNATIKEFENLFHKHFRVLDVGCGEGQNAIYLAKQGYHVDAFDLSEHGIAKVNARCEASGVKLNAFIADLTEYEFKQNYDVVMSFGTLHFVRKNDWKKFVREAKKHTNNGGIHIIQLFTDVVPASEDIEPFAVGLARDEEIKELYENWEILQFKSYVFEDEHPGVPKHLHASNKIVAKKYNCG